MPTTSKQTPPPDASPTSRSRISTCAGHARSEAGQAVVEFALVVPVVVVVLFAIVLFGVALNDSIDETQLASEAARFAAVDANCIVKGSPHTCGEGEKEGLLQWTREQGDNSNVKEATATICSPTSAVGDYVEVRLKYMYDWFKASKVFELFGAKFSAETPIESTAHMRIEAAPSTPYPTTC